MRPDLLEVDIDNMSSSDLVGLAEEVRATGTPRLLKRGERALAMLTPVESKVEEQDALLDMIGMFESDGPGDVSENKYKYLAEAYYPREQ